MPEHNVAFDLSNTEENEISVETEAKEEITIEQPLYPQPVSQAKPLAKTKKAPNRKITSKSLSKALSKEEIKRNQIEINFGEGVALDDELVPIISANKMETKLEKSTKVKKAATVELETQVIILSVVMPENHQMSGAVLLPTLLTLGMKYGEMNIFHRHQDNAGNGAVTFSLANMLNPGSFDLDSMETFVTQGVSLFMTLPNAGDPFAAFEQMLSAAKQLAQEFNAQLLDDKRNVMTKQTEQHYVSKIREFDRQHRLASVE